MQVEVDVSEADVGQIRTGQDVFFTVDAFPERNFKATLREVRNVATDIQNVVTYKIIADVENDALILRPGMTANVTIVVARVDDVLKVPNGALRFKPPGEKAEQGTAKRTPIRERALYRDMVSRVGLDKAQADAFVRILEKAGRKLKASHELPEQERDLKGAFKNFYRQVFTGLYKILRDDQYGKFRDYVSAFRETRKKRGLYKGRPAAVYVPGRDGLPKRLRIVVGVTDDDATQVIQGNLKEGDPVIVGLRAGGRENKDQTGNIFSMIFKRR
jgi:HlyD family secretion protein